jgi:hypothetical protein
MKKLFEKYHTDKTKYSYFYEYWLKPKQFKNMLEIGAFKGGSMRAWKELWPKAKIYGIECNPDLRNESPDLDIFVGDQTDINFLNRVVDNMGTPDLIIDDGGHKMSQQITSFIALFPKLQSGGYYIIEDLETSYLQPWIDQPQTTINFLNGLINKVNFDGRSHLGEDGVVDIESRGEQADYYSKIISQIIFSNNICLIIKK